MQIKIVSYSHKKFVIEDMSYGRTFEMPERTLFDFLNLSHNVLAMSLVDRKYSITSIAVEM